MFKKFIYLLLGASLILSCTKEPIIKYVEPIITYTRDTVVSESGQSRFTYEDIIICSEGNWQQDNGQLAFYSGTTGILTNKWFNKINGSKLGDTPNDIIQVNDTLIAVAVNWSNIIQFIRPDGTACGATEDIPNNRRMCVDDNGFLYITSYAHKCGEQTFDKGYLAKVDPSTKKVVATCEVGWEPEGVRFYEGNLYVVNTGGYAFAEGHDYENTISVIDASTMTLVKTISIEADLNDDGELDRVINLYGEVSQVDEYLCINSPGDYYSTPAATVIFNCATDTYNVYKFPCTYNTPYEGKFLTVGSAFSFDTFEYKFYINTIDPVTNEVTEGVINDEITSCIASLQAPYEIYASPYTKSLFFTDAASYANAGYLYAFDANGSNFINKEQLYLCPAHILAVPHYVIDPVYTTTITITPHISYPNTKSSISFDVNDYHREKFLEAWTSAKNKI